jgi:hypothetical protein
MSWECRRPWKVGTLVGFCFVGCQKPRSRLADGQNGTRAQGKRVPGSAVGEWLCFWLEPPPLPRGLPCVWRPGGQQFGGPAPLGALCNGVFSSMSTSRRHLVPSQHLRSALLFLSGPVTRPGRIVSPSRNKSPSGALVVKA